MIKHQTWKMDREFLEDDGFDLQAFGLVFPFACAVSAEISYGMRRIGLPAIGRFNGVSMTRQFFCRNSPTDRPQTATDFPPFAVNSANAAAGVVMNSRSTESLFSSLTVGQKGWLQICPSRMNEGWICRNRISGVHFSVRSSASRHPCYSYRIPLKTLRSALHRRGLEARRVH